MPVSRSASAVSKAIVNTENVEVNEQDNSSTVEHNTSIINLKLDSSQSQLLKKSKKKKKGKK